MQATLASVASANLTTPSFSNSNPNPNNMNLVNLQDAPTKNQEIQPETGPTRRRRSSKLTGPVPERLKRGRKSKSNAIIAISSHSPSSPRQSRPNQERTHQKREPKAHPARHPSRVQINQKLCNVVDGKLDFSSIRTESPRSNPRARQKDRLFELEHCPVFYPTPDEFKDPMKYFELIGSKLKSHGIGKVVPPLGWRPPFVLDTEQFKFKTRLQRLNSMEASARANTNFMEQLYLFHKQQGNSAAVVTNGSKLQVPVIDYRPVDLWKLRKQINEMGGYDNITSQRKWSSLAKAMGYNVKASPAISFKLKAAYIKIIAPFDEYVNRVKQSPTGRLFKKEERGDRPLADSLSPLTSSTADHDESEQSHINHGGTGQLEDPTKPVTRLSNGHRVSNASEVDQSLNGKIDDASDNGDVCEVCGTDEDDSNILLCDYCDKGFHLQCLTPPLEAVPDGNWYCDACIVSTGNEFGFEEGKEHTLLSFQKRADSFKKVWLENHPIPEKANKNSPSLEIKEEKKEEGEKDEKDEKHEKKAEEEDPALLVWSTPALSDELVLEDHIEREFWRLVESPSESVEIEYGSDIHSAVYGSGFPNLEKHPFEPYSRDGWNLNNLPIAPGSLLRFIKSDIAGMTQPWIYVGMVFSTFAWHKEDHYTYSINYHHWGDTKTWYGVPGEDDGKLEEAMKMAAPELFEQQPDLMFQLVTLMSPGRLKRAGVRTYVCDQRPNEFVITCPRSYHSGFNHGFNLNEAVNFCLPDWLNEGSLCVKHYKALSKMPVFSHDELLVTIFNNEKSPRVSRWLLPHFKEMVEREIAERKSAIGHISNLSPDIIIEPSDLPEDQVQCHHCKTFTFLSQVISLDSPKVSCLDHSHILGNTQKKLRYKFSDDELQAMLLRVNSRSIKAGRILDMSSIEQRTSTRKRKPSAALLEATRAVLPMAQKMKTSHTSLHRDAQSDTSTQMDNSLSAAREESLEHEEDERAERLIMVSETGLRGVFRTKAEEMRSEVVKEEQVTESSLPNESRNSRSASRSAPPPIPSRENPKSLEQPQLARPGSQVLPKNLSPPNQSTPSAPFSSLIAQKSSNSSTGPGSRRTDAPNVMDKRRVGRPPKTAEVRAAEAEARRAMREAALHDKEAQHKPINSTPGKRAQVVAQIDVGGSASIVQLSPGAQRPTLEPLKSSPLRITQTSQGSRKGKQKSSVSSAPPSKNLSQTIDPSRIPTPPSKTGPSTNERPRQNVIRIKSHNRIGSHPAEPKTVVKQVDDPIPHSKSSTQPYSQTCIGTPSRLHGNQFQEAIPDYSGKSRQVVLTSSPKPHPSIAAPLDVLPGTRSPTPSSLMSILNPIAMDPVTSFERNLSSKLTQSNELNPSSRPTYRPQPLSHIVRPSHPPQSSSSHFPPYLERPRSPKLAPPTTGTQVIQNPHPRHPQQQSSQFPHSSHHTQQSPAPTQQSPPKQQLQQPAHYKPSQSPYQSHASQRSPSSSSHHDSPQGLSPRSFLRSAQSDEPSIGNSNKREPTNWTYSILDRSQSCSAQQHSSTNQQAYWNKKRNGSNSPSSWWGGGDQESPTSHSS